jgi:hypothetical protein
MVRKLSPCRFAAILIILVLTTSVFVASFVVPSPARAASPHSPATALLDNFTHDTNLNASLWQVNGPVGSVFGADNCPSCTLLPLDPSFSSAGMEIAQVSGSYEVGTIQSIESFTPPVTVNAVVKGTVSNGHPFVFGLTSSNATSGVQITGNLNPDDCSNEVNCGSPATCGTSANPSIPPNQCYYGIYAKIGTSNGSWAKSTKLYLTPSVGAVYALQISIDGSGSAQYNVSQGGQVLGKSTAQVGTGPFYIIFAQSEGAPVPGPGPNQAYWMSVSLTPTAPSPSPSPSPTSGPSSTLWIILAIVAAVVLVLIVLAWNSRRRGLTVTVLDSGTLSPLPGAGVSADGPKNFSGSTGNDGRVAFGGARVGDYSVKAGATGYNSSVPVTVSVWKTTTHTVRLDRVAPSAQERAGIHAPLEEPNRPIPPPQMGATWPTPPGSAPVVARPESAPSASGREGLEGLEGWGGERIREIIKTFQMKGAVSPETALTAEDLGLSRLFVRIMKRRRGRTKIFVEVNGRYYLDQRALPQVK